MGRRIAAPAVFLLMLAIGPMVHAQGGAPGVDLVLGAQRYVLACRVGVLDTVSMNFVCQTNGAAHRFWLARSTHFVAGGPHGSPFHLQTGQTVQVTFHNAGRIAVADVVSL